MYILRVLYLYLTRHQDTATTAGIIASGKHAKLRVPIRLVYPFPFSSRYGYPAAPEAIQTPLTFRMLGMLHLPKSSNPIV